MIEELVAWCATSDTLGGIRSKARGEFPGYDEPGAVDYLPGTGDIDAQERRFLSWFCFSFYLSDVRHPAEMAAVALLSETALDSALKSIQAARYVTAITTMVRPGKSVFLKIQDEKFEISSRVLSRSLYRDDVLCAHIVPTKYGSWLVCPGWLVWPRLTLAPAYAPS
jgi:hypothetical protein